MAFESPNPMKVSVGSSSTDYGSKNGGGKVKFKAVAPRPITTGDSGSGAKRNSGMNSK